MIETIAEHNVDLSLLPVKANVLDIGCRNFQFTNYFREKLHRVFSIDIDHLPEDQAYYQCAISDHDGRTGILRTHDKQATRMCKGTEIPCYTLYTFSRAVGVEFWDLIKMDVEGSEYDQFKREKDLLLSQDKEKCLFYFSTISIYYKDSPYTRHKKRMEQLIKSNFNHYNIIRLGNISWGKNPKTFLNFLRNEIKEGKPVNFVDEFRYLLDKDDLRLMTDNLPLKGQNEVCIFSKMGKPKDLV